MRYGAIEIDLSRIEQLADNGQLSAIGYLISRYYRGGAESYPDLVEGLREVFNDTEEQGLDALPPYIMGTLAMPRFFELVATVNRMRNLRLME